MTFVSADALTLICAVHDMDARPLFFSEDGVRRGYEPEAAEVVAAAIGRRVDWVPRRWDRFRSALEAGEGDAIWCGSAITDERRLIHDYSRPYAVFGESVLMRRVDAAGTPEDLRGRRVGAIAASTNIALARSFPDVEVVEFDGSSDDVFAEMCDAVRTGKVDAIVDDEPAFGAIDEESDLAVAFTVASGNAWGAALRKGSDDIREAIDAGLERVVADGALAAVWHRWLPRSAFPL